MADPFDEIPGYHELLGSDILVDAARQLAHDLIQEGWDEEMAEGFAISAMILGFHSR